ncbi:MAG: class I SAM-dependent methyltransferase [Thermodesulfobacteriota bacterium]
MINSQNPPRLIKTEWGFYQYDPLPSDEELNHYYEKRYYQEGLGSYEAVYSDEEISYFRLKARLIYSKCSTLVDMRKGQRLIDIGCGEGWVMDEFSRQGLTVLGLDFSRHGIEKWHPHLLPFFEKGGLFELLEEKVRVESKFDFLLLANVIEHVKDPVKLLRETKRMMHPNSILIIVAPNDFSPLHEFLLTKKKITREFWLCYPDHLSYFNKESMSNLLSDLSFKIHSIVADNPVDLNLLNDNSNYIEDPSKGKNIHFFRVRSDNFLGSRDPEKLLRIYEILGSMGVGRDLNYYCSIAK